MLKITLTSSEYSPLDEMRTLIAQQCVEHKAGKNTKLMWNDTYAELEIFITSAKDRKEVAKVIGS